MHVVISMNQKWKIILSTCLVIAICFATASATIESPFTKSSFDKSSAIAFADEKVVLSWVDWSSKTNCNWCFIPPTSLPTPLPTQSIQVAITMSEALEIADTYGVRDPRVCGGIKAARLKVLIDGDRVWVWRVSGRCGPIVYLDMYSGDLVKDEYTWCECIEGLK